MALTEFTFRMLIQNSYKLDKNQAGKSNHKQLTRQGIGFTYFKHQTLSIEFQTKRGFDLKGNFDSLILLSIKNFSLTRQNLFLIWII
jgi:hypothetical protein